MNLDAWLDIQPAKKLYTIKEASRILTKKFGKEIKEHNISYLVQYGRVNKYKIKNRVYVDIDEVENYYKKLFLKKEKNGKKNWDLNWIGI